MSAQPSGPVIDPVCGMKVDPSTARFKAAHAGQNYFFCCAGCMTKFQTNPAGVLAAPPKPMGSGLVGIGMKPASGGGGALVSIGTPAKGSGPTAPSHPGRASAANTGLGTHADARAYVCPMCPEVRQVGPGPCPKCGMALEPESPVLDSTKTEYTCPMHPEIVRPEPGSCPICGMGLSLAP